MLYFRPGKQEDCYVDLIDNGKLREGRNDYVMIAFDDDDLIGVCSVDIICSNAIINSIYVSETSRGISVGTTLIKTIINTAEKAGLDYVSIPKNQELHNFLIKLGFKHSEEDNNMMSVKVKGYFNSCSCCKRDE